MSELEIQQRQEYKRKRKKWILIQTVAILLLAALTLGSFWAYNQMNQTFYVKYTESANIDYKVQYLKNDYFDTEWIDKDQAYISELINGISADFFYQMNIDTTNIDFDYQYLIKAKLLIENSDNGTTYYTAEEILLPIKKLVAQNGDTVCIKESVAIDFVKYHHIASSFIETYKLKKVACTLAVSLDVGVVSANRQFNRESENTYTTSLNIPLAVDTFNIYRTSGAPENDVKVLEYNNIAGRNIFLILSFIAFVLTALLFITLLIFLNLTKNEDITYAAKIRKILRAYSSYIQRIDGEFDHTGYQVIYIKTFNEMLGIRDTIQSPILVSENRDETMTQFFIPTNTKLLYIFEIKVDNYDQIYSIEKKTEPAWKTTTVLKEAPVVKEPESPAPNEAQKVEVQVIREKVIEKPTVTVHRVNSTEKKSRFTLPLGIICVTLFAIVSKITKRKENKTYNFNFDPKKFK